MAVATIPTLEEQATFESSTDDYFIRKTSQILDGLYHVNAAPSPSFTQTIKMLANDMAEKRQFGL